MRGVGWTVSASASAAGLWLALGHGSLAARAGGLLVHAAASLLSGASLRRALPAEATGPVFPLLASIAFFLPVAGPLGLWVGLVLPLAHPHAAKAEPPWREVPIPDLPVRPPELDPQGALELGPVLRDAKSLERRQKAIVATRAHPDSEAVPHLLAALADPADDVRLLAYAMLRAREQAHDAQLRASQELVKSGAPGAKAALARDSLDFALSGLVQGDARRELLTRARALSEEEANPSAELHVLRARIRSALGDADGARESLVLAAGALPARTLAPYLAELAFLEGDFASTAAWLAAVPSFDARVGPLAAVRAFWS